MARYRGDDRKVYKTLEVEYTFQTDLAWQFVNVDTGELIWVPKSVCQYEEGTEDALVEVWYCDKNDL